MAEEYKYEIGEKVGYTEAISKDVECPTCHHVETEYTYKKRRGEIKDRSYKDFYRVADFEPTVETEIVDGKVVHKPYMAALPVVRTGEPAYFVGGSWRSEDSLTK